SPTPAWPGPRAAVRWPGWRDEARGRERRPRARPCVRSQARRRPGYHHAGRAMPVYKLDERLEFPPADLADDGLLAVGGDLSPERLVPAYSRGIFPWYEEGLPILWHSPDPRMVLEAHQLRVPTR